MGIYLITGLGMFVLVLFLLALIGMFSFRASSLKNKQKNEIVQLRRRVDNIENCLEQKK